MGKTSITEVMNRIETVLADSQNTIFDVKTLAYKAGISDRSVRKHIVPLANAKRIYLRKTLRVDSNVSFYAAKSIFGNNRMTKRKSYEIRYRGPKNETGIYGDWSD